MSCNDATITNDDVRHKIFQILDDDPEMITIMKDRYVTEDMWKFCIQKDASLFKEMRHPSEDMCLFAVQEDGMNLQLIISKFKHIDISYKMVWTAIGSQPSAIYCVPKKYLTIQLKEYAYSLDPSLMENDPYVRPEFLRNMIKEHPEYIKYVMNPDEDLVLDAIRRAPNVCAYLSDFTPKIIATIKELYPELLMLIPRLQPYLEFESAAKQAL